MQWYPILKYSIYIFRVSICEDASVYRSYIFCKHIELSARKLVSLKVNVIFKRLSLTGMFVA
jgi:hypothetical protein